MRRIIREWKSLGRAEFAKTRKRKAANRIRALYHQTAKTPVISSRYGVKMVANWPDTTFRFCIDATYGFDLHDLLTGYREPFTFLDIGSNQGLYSLIACKNPACKSVYAFEPMPQTFSFLQRNIDANRLDSVTPINAAISSNTGKATLTLDPNHTGGATLHAPGDATRTQVTIDTIDHRELNTLITPIGKIFAKVDVEGHEETVFAELAKCNFSDTIDRIHYEVDEDWVDPKKLQSLLETIGMDQFERIDGRRQHHYDIIACRSI